jgi:hypothetical protein
MLSINAAAAALLKTGPAAALGLSSPLISRA